MVTGHRAGYPVSVDYSSPLLELIGPRDYAYVNPAISKDFAMVHGPLAVTIELAHFDRVIGSRDVLATLVGCDLRPATLPELLAFGRSYPAAPHEFPIIGLGSVWRSDLDRRLVPYLGGGGLGRVLLLGWLRGGWDKRFRFAAVAKSQ